MHIRRIGKGLLSWMARQRYRLLAGIAVVGFIAWHQLPTPLFQDPYSMVISDRHGVLLGARIAADGQWRFPPGRAVPDVFATALCRFEDKRFFGHSGVDPLALMRALWLNVKAGSVVSGGSTISMQVIRLALNNPPRTIPQKIREIFLAFLLEARYSKNEILGFWAAQAPFGGNVVGLEAASWRYYGISPDRLSIAQAACLAVLPNNPALVNPARNRNKLKGKRNRLLADQMQHGDIAQTAYELALLESLPSEPLPLPQVAGHLLTTLHELEDQFRFRTSLKAGLQRQVTRLLALQSKELARNGVHNMAALVMKIPSGKILAYVGNVPWRSLDHGTAVDIIPAPRSSGSILKPLLYALIQEEGLLLPTALVPDIPSNFSGYRPENYSGTYAGAVPAATAITKSLNVPAVRMLSAYGQPKFHYALRQWGFEDVRFPAAHYGLSLILGGAEVSLWDLVKVYGRLATCVMTEGDAVWPKPQVLKDRPTQGVHISETLLDAGAIYLMFDAMTALKRPAEEAAWKQFSTSRKVAWKTGTSFGSRDAWSVGVTPGYVVGVWAGNADGEGRPGLVGAHSAAPLMFRIFNLLPETGWFDLPAKHLPDVEVCAQSGYRKGPYCSKTKVIRVTKAGLHSPLCPYHRLLQVNETGRYRVNPSCAGPAERKQQSWFVLPPAMEFYYRKRHPAYEQLPPFKAGCNAPTTIPAFRVIYPDRYARLFLPVDVDGRPQEAIFEAVHRQADANLYWHLDEKYIGATRGIHQITVRPEAGKHVLTVVDQHGERVVIPFEVLDMN